jgi:tetratricopeptide (TPR) repeat protein
LAAFRGLYGLVPFLFSLGLAGILAFLMLQAIRLTYQPNVALLHWPLKRAGRLIPGGYRFLAALAALLLLWFHSGAVQLHGFLRHRLHERSAVIRPSWSEELRSPAALTAEQSTLVDQALEHGLFVERWGLLPDTENDLELAWFYLLRREPQQVDRHLRSAIPRQPNNASVRLDSANFLLAQNRPAEAAALYREALGVQPDLSAARINLGLSLALSGDFAGAIRSFDEALAREPNSALLHYNYGLIEAERGDLSAAIARFRKALELDASLLQARKDLARAFCSSGQIAEGIQEYQRVLRSDPNDDETRQILGQLRALGSSPSRNGDRLQISRKSLHGVE